MLVLEPLQPSRRDVVLRFHQIQAYGRSGRSKRRFWILTVQIRALFNAEQHWLIVLARFTDRFERSPGVDETFLFRNAEGPWPLGARWDGEAVIETYSAAGDSGGPAGFGLRVPAGLIQLVNEGPRRGASPEAAAVAVLSFRGWGRSLAYGAPFDAVERTRVAEASGRTNPNVSTGLAVVGSGPAGGIVPSSTMSGRKTRDVPPVWPEAARQANLRGVVIVELNIGSDGSVTDARILRGIPLLNDAALECVRQWRYEPLMLNGRAIPTVITATVSFP